MTYAKQLETMYSEELAQSYHYATKSCLLIMSKYRKLQRDMLEAKCPDCGKRAEVNDDMTKVKCRHCQFFASYEDYIEIMKGKAVDISDNFQMNWDRNPF